MRTMELREIKYITNEAIDLLEHLDAGYDNELLYVDDMDILELALQMSLMMKNIKNINRISDRIFYLQDIRIAQLEEKIAAKQ